MSFSKSGSRNQNLYESSRILVRCLKCWPRVFTFSTAEINVIKNTSFLELLDPCDGVKMTFYTSFSIPYCRNQNLCKSSVRLDHCQNFCISFSIFKLFLWGGGDVCTVMVSFTDLHEMQPTSNSINVEFTKGQPVLYCCFTSSYVALMEWVR